MFFQLSFELVIHDRGRARRFVISVNNNTVQTRTLYGQLVNIAASRTAAFSFVKVKDIAQFRNRRGITNHFELFLDQSTIHCDIAELRLDEYCSLMVS